MADTVPRRVYASLRNHCFGYCNVRRAISNGAIRRKFPIFTDFYVALNIFIIIGAPDGINQIELIEMKVTRRRAPCRLIRMPSCGRVKDAGFEAPRFGRTRNLRRQLLLKLLGKGFFGGVPQAVIPYPVSKPPVFRVRDPKGSGISLRASPKLISWKLMIKILMIRDHAIHLFSAQSHLLPFTDAGCEVEPASPFHGQRQKRTAAWVGRTRAAVSNLPARIRAGSS